jgi:hypothetical protein
MMDRWTINIETKSDKEESIAIPSHKVLKVSEPVESFHSLRILICLNQFSTRQGNAVGKCTKSSRAVSAHSCRKNCDKSIRTSSKSNKEIGNINREL